MVLISPHIYTEHYWYRSSEFGTGASRRPCTRKWYNCTERWFRDTGLIGKVVTRVLDLARRHQTGRVTENVTTVTFTEGWFRDSGGGTS
ncbi:MAG: hypothetical protein WBI50_06530 [Acetomicrobium sp.]